VFAIGRTAIWRHIQPISLNLNFDASGQDKDLSIKLTAELCCNLNLAIWA